MANLSGTPWSHTLPQPHALPTPHLFSVALASSGQVRTNTCGIATLALLAAEHRYTPRSCLGELT